MPDYSSMKKAELIALCEEAELSTNGTKADLIARLEAPQEVVAEPEVEEVVEPVETNTSDDLSDEDFIRQAYLDILGREADPAGLRHYSLALGFHKTLTREQVLRALKRSDEARSR